VMEETGLREMVFIRVSFFLRLFSRAYGKMCGYNYEQFLKARPAMLAMRRLDTLLDNTRFMKANKINLVWGFTK
jgi:hypothetical protein